MVRLLLRILGVLVLAVMVMGVLLLLAVLVWVVVELLPAEGVVLLPAAVAVDLIPAPAPAPALIPAVPAKAVEEVTTPTARRAGREIPVEVTSRDRTPAMGERTPVEDMARAENQSSGATRAGRMGGGVPAAPDR